MDDFVAGKLNDWGLGHLLERFKEQKIDEESFICLEDQDIIDLISEVGPRAKFRRNLKLLKVLPSTSPNEGASFPSVIMGNVNSLQNKIDELSARNNQRIYRECSLYFFTETWLNHLVPNANVDLPGFTAVRADRDTNACGKNKGGGLIMYVNNCWCNPGNISRKTVSFCRDLELLAVSVKPYYLPKEISCVIAVCVYIPPRATARIACEKILSETGKLQTEHPKALMIISGDFNHAKLGSTLTDFYQVVDCPTRNSRTIDLMYVNVRDAYKATPLPPLGKCDHNLIHLQPQHIPLVQWQPGTTIKRWSPEMEDAPRDNNIAVGDELINPHGEDIEGLTQCLTDLDF